MIRFNALVRHGCVCCRQLGYINRSVDIHHLVEGNKRLGDNETIPLCPYHHRGVIPAEMSQRDAERLLGPTRHYHGRKPFEARWGTERELLKNVDDAIQNSRVRSD